MALIRTRNTLDSLGFNLLISANNLLTSVITNIGSKSVVDLSTSWDSYMMSEITNGVYCFWAIIFWLFNILNRSHDVFLKHSAVFALVKSRSVVWMYYSQNLSTNNVMYSIFISCLLSLILLTHSSESHILIFGVESVNYPTNYSRWNLTYALTALWSMMSASITQQNSLISLLSN
jgi:hypothetical protein